MRYLLSILSLLLMLQPVSWAFGAPMYMHGQMDHESSIPTMLMSMSLGEHCEYGGSKQLSDSEARDLIGQDDGHLMINCVVAGASAVGSFTAIGETVEPTYLSIVLHPANIFFHTRTESPEIRPPHNIRS